VSHPDQETHAAAKGRHEDKIALSIGCEDRPGICAAGLVRHLGAPLTEGWIL
jgi:hypothetical protein